LGEERLKELDNKPSWVWTSCNQSSAISVDYDFAAGGNHDQKSNTARKGKARSLKFLARQSFMPLF